MKRASHRRKPAHRTAAMVISDGLLLALTLTGLFLFQFNVYGLPGSRNMVLTACLAAAVLTLAVFSLPKYRWAAVLTIIIFGAALLWRYWDSVFQGAQAVYHTVAHVITESTDFPGEFPIPMEWTAEEIWAASNHFLTAIIFALALPLGWAVVRRRAFLPVLLLTLPWLIPIFLAEFPPDAVSLSMLAACWMTMLLTSLTARKDPAGGARLTFAALPAALLALLCICLIFPVKSYVYPNWAATAAQRLTEVGENIQAGVGGSGRADAIDLSHAGPRRFTGRSVLRVESDWMGRVYLRGAAYANYTGGSWEQLSREALTELDGLTLDHSVMFPSEGGQEEQTYSATITHLNGSTRMAYYLYQPVNLFENLDGASYVADSYLRLEKPRKEYTVEFSDPDDLYHSINDDTYRKFVYEHYLDVPEELTAILGDWQMLVVKRAVQEIGAIQTAQEIAHMFEISTEYDLQTPVTPEGEDFVTYFLTTSLRGYCVHYASAAAMLLRMGGVPTRYVSGYTAEIVGGEVLVPDSAAHAWIEIYLDGYGWYPVEVTPAAAFDDTVEKETTPIAEPSTSAEPTRQPVQSEPPVQSESPEKPSREPSAVPSIGNQGGGEGGSLDLSWLCYAAGVLVVLGVPVLYRVFRRRRWNRLTTLPDRNQAVLEIYGWYHKLTSWGGKPDQQIEDLARKAKFSRHVLTAEEHREAVIILRREIARLSVKQPFWKRPFFWYWFIWK